MPQYAYKLLNPDLTSYGCCQWTVGEWKETSGEGELCGPGWLHAYQSPTIAHFLNAIHANIVNAVMYRVEVDGEKMADHNLKVGYTRMRLDQEWPMPVPTTEQRVRFAIACAASVYAAPTFLEWAGSWVKNIDRSCAAAATVAAAAWAADASAWAAARAADASAWAAEAAARAARDEDARAAEAAAVAARAWAYGSVYNGHVLDLESIAQWAMSDSVTLPVTDK